MNTLEEWTRAVRRALDLRDDAESGDLSDEQTIVLDLAREAAHGVARPAAPLTTYLFGMAVANGADPRRTAEKLMELARGWTAETPPASPSGTDP